MARLNEVPMSTDSMETLRKKFLRQNRDIARVNSAQSLRIRSLESECGRLLSDNLTLNGRILELERDLEECREAQRIADHALDIKAKMEAQLAEWGAMLGGLGVERAAKRHAPSSPGGTRVARRRKSTSRSPLAIQRPRNSRSSAEMAALQEGRLPAIQENTTYSRRTMNHNEILSIRTEIESSNESPDLGPPPTSRFVEEPVKEPVKVDSPSKSTGVLQPSPKLKIESLLPSSSPSRPGREPTKQSSVASEASSHDRPRSNKSARAQAHPPVKAGSKRKFGDENDDFQASRAFLTTEKASSKIAQDKPLVVRDLKDCHTTTELDEREAHTTDPTKTRPRQPLADKSRNDGASSPKKLPKAATTGDLVKIMADPLKEISLKAAPLKKKRLVPIKLPPLTTAEPSATKAPLEPETPSADPGVVFPDTPETKSTSEKPRDTPPPADISSQGETSRPSRRVRASVSYAEPNLRDKMRRPTKEMLDAVSGEGKYRRTSSAQHITSASASKPKAEGELMQSASSSQLQAAEAAIEHEAARRSPATSPLLQRNSTKEVPPASQVGQPVAERRRRPSSRQSQLLEKLGKTEEEQDEEDAGEESRGIDPYEFRDESTVLEQSMEIQKKGKGNKATKRSTVAKNISTDDQSTSGSEAKKPARKRMSMAAPKKSSMLDDGQDADSSYEASLEAAMDLSSSLSQDKASRRRSMML